MKDNLFMGQKPSTIAEMKKFFLYMQPKKVVAVRKEDLLVLNPHQIYQETELKFTTSIAATLENTRLVEENVPLILMQL